MVYGIVLLPRVAAVFDFASENSNLRGQTPEIGN
jgi:hypothetical protein